MITIRLFWMLFSWLYWLPMECGALKVTSIFMGMDTRRSYQILLFLCLWDNHSGCYCGSLWKATWVHKKLMFL